MARLHLSDLACGVESQNPQSHARLLAIAKEAWKNSARCIGRLHWNSLELIDARDAVTAREVFEACVRHLRVSTNGGRIRSVVTLFNPEERDGRTIRIWNRQLIRYAGYRQPDGSIMGDPEQLEFTDRVAALGWEAPASRTPFDLLPLVIEVPGESPEIFDLPPDSVLEISISHPELPWFSDLALKWHAVPVISDMALEGEGMRFQAVLFSGFYMGTEIASRNFGDEARYNLLPVVADRMGLDRSVRSSLWKDRVLIELNVAVLHSFRQAGVTIVDHHTASDQFMQHLKNEEGCGRKVPGDWSWLVPPMSGSACPVFHRYYDGLQPGPAFVEQPAAWKQPV